MVSKLGIVVSRLGLAVSNFGLAGSKPVFGHGSDWLHTGQSFDRLCFYISCLCLCMRSRRGSIVRVCAASLSCLRCPVGCRQRRIGYLHRGRAPAVRLVQRGPAPALRLVMAGTIPAGVLMVGRNRHPRCHHQPWNPRWHRWHRHRHLQCSLRQLQGRPRSTRRVPMQPCRPRPRPRPLQTGA